MNMKPLVSAEMRLVQDRCTKWHNDDLRYAQRRNEAWDWLCDSRKMAPANEAIWDLRHRWPACRETYLRQLQSGAYRLSPHVGGGDTPSGDVVG